MICELAVVTGTHPDQWLTTDEAIIATTLDVLREHNRKGR